MTAVAYDALVIGAGPAGAAAATVLAQAGARVLLCEAGRLPRHRLCGEFVSPEARTDLEALGIDLEGLGAVPIRSASVVSRGAMANALLPAAAFGISRFILDAALVRNAVAQGAELRTETHATDWTGDFQHGFEVELAGATAARVRARVVVGAFGKHLQRTPGRATRVGLKEHRIGAIPGPAQVQLDAFPGGYVGVAPIGASRFNVCLVARADVVRRHRGAGAAGVLAAIAARVPRLAALYAATTPDPASRTSESELVFGVRHPLWRGVLLAGDAAAPPHPLSGDGIAMALRSGRLAAEHAITCLQAECTAPATQLAYERAWRREFAARLRWDSLLHAALERPAIITPVVHALGHWPRAFDALIARTRGTPEGAAMHRRASA